MRKGVLECLNCGNIFYSPGEGEIKCPSCGHPYNPLRTAPIQPVLPPVESKPKPSSTPGWAKVLAVLGGLWLLGTCFTLFVGVLAQANLPTGGLALTRAEREATEQAMLDQNARAFEDISVRVGEVERWEGVQPDGGLYVELFLTFPVYVRNNGSVPHEFLLRYATGLSYDEFGYKSVVLQPSEEVSFKVRFAAFKGIPNWSTTFRVGRFDFQARLETVDGVSRENTSWDERDMDWTIVMTDDKSIYDYELAGQ